MATEKKNGRRAVIVGGVRTPFVKAFTDFTKLDTIALGVAAVTGLLKKSGLRHRDIEAMIWGGVILPTTSPNLAREIALDVRLDPSCEGFTVTRACASGLQAITAAASAIERGDNDVIIAGGSDSTSNASITLPPKVVHAMAPLALGGKASPADYLGVLSQLMPISEILPRQPKIAERSTGEVMGESAERMAKRNEISRKAQDEFAVRSHHRAAAAIAAGRFDDEIVPVQTPGGQVGARGRTRARGHERREALEAAARLREGRHAHGRQLERADRRRRGRAAHERREGQVARPQAARRDHVVVVRRRRSGGPAPHGAGARDAEGARSRGAQARGRRPGRHARGVRGAGAQRPQDAGERAVRARAARQGDGVGEIDPDRLNVHGGSLALGHPFGATGARMVTTMANELARTGKRAALLGLCAAGGLGAAAVLERVD